MLHSLIFAPLPLSLVPCLLCVFFLVFLFCTSIKAFPFQLAARGGGSEGGGVEHAANPKMCSMLCCLHGQALRKSTIAPFFVLLGVV